MKTMYAVTKIEPTGLRGLLGHAQGRDMFPTREVADKWLEAFKANNDEFRLEMIYGAQALGSFRVDAVECYDHGDPVGRYVDEEAVS